MREHLEEFTLARRTIDLLLARAFKKIKEEYPDHRELAPLYQMVHKGALQRDDLDQIMTELQQEFRLLIPHVDEELEDTTEYLTGHIDLIFKDDFWYLNSFFYDSVEDLPVWHSQARAILRRLVEKCGYLKLQDAAFHPITSMRMDRYLWLRKNREHLETNGDMTAFFTDDTSYYHVAADSNDPKTGTSKKSVKNGRAHKDPVE